MWVKVAGIIGVNHTLLEYLQKNQLSVNLFNRHILSDQAYVLIIY
jgi:hypothetical protein